MAFSSGLSVPTMSTHHPAGKERMCEREINKERERREDEAFSNPKLHVSVPDGV